MMTYKEFYDEIINAVNSRPKYIRYGQSVFNYIDEHYGVARIAQLNYGVDCFYNDDKVDEFMDVCYRIYKILKENEKVQT